MREGDAHSNRDSANSCANSTGARLEDSIPRKRKTIPAVKSPLKRILLNKTVRTSITQGCPSMMADYSPQYRYITSSQINLPFFAYQEGGDTEDLSRPRDSSTSIGKRRGILEPASLPLPPPLNSTNNMTKNHLSTFSERAQRVRGAEDSDVDTLTVQSSSSAGSTRRPLASSASSGASASSAAPSIFRRSDLRHLKRNSTTPIFYCQGEKSESEGDFGRDYPGFWSEERESMLCLKIANKVYDSDSSCPTKRRRNDPDSDHGYDYQYFEIGEGGGTGGISAMRDNTVPRSRPQPLYFPEENPQPPALKLGLGFPCRRVSSNPCPKRDDRESSEEGPRLRREREELRNSTDGREGESRTTASPPSALMLSLSPMCSREAPERRSSSTKRSVIVGDAEPQHPFFGQWKGPAIRDDGDGEELEEFGFVVYRGDRRSLSTVSSVE